MDIWFEPTTYLIRGLYANYYITDVIPHNWFPWEIHLQLKYGPSYKIQQSIII